MSQLMAPPRAESITLYFREGSSDKVYQLNLQAKDQQFVVNFAFGRRGSTLQTGTKTEQPVDYDTAKEIYDQVVKEKTAKGYSPGPNGTPYQATDLASRFTCLVPQLLNPIEASDLDRLLGDTEHGMQEKYDGRRILLLKEQHGTTGVNRKGLTVGLPSSIIASAQAIPGAFVMDGESVGDVYFAFDLLSCNNEDHRAYPYRKRFEQLARLLQNDRAAHIDLAQTAFEPWDKKRLFEQLRRERKEGVVFKQLEACYTPGRPHRGGSQLKYKFYATLSAVVSKVNPQRSVELRLLSKDGWVIVGNVSIPANHFMPKIGAVVEVRYLYAYRESGCLYQPTYLGARTDVEAHECLAAQRKFKSSDPDEE